MKRQLIFAAVLLQLSLSLAFADYSFSIGRGLMEIKVGSSVFDHGGIIPRKYTCDGSDTSPPLKWSKGPDGTKSYAVIVDDPDAPMGTWVHWVIYNIPVEIAELSEDISLEKIASNGITQGMNDFRKIGYGGPCPPGGEHRYFFKVYALNTALSLHPGATKKELLNAMENHVVATGELIGRYSRR